MGRFLSPDWSAEAEPIPYAELGNPQSLNLYAYVGNNPLARIDADGHEESQVDDFNASFDQSMSNACTSGMTFVCPASSPGQFGANPQTQLDASEQVSENRYESIIDNDYDPAGVAHDTIQWYWTGGSGTRDDSDREFAAEAVGLAWAQKQEGGVDPDIIQMEIQYIYDNLTLYAGHGYDDNGHLGLSGGNWNFNTQIGTQNILNMGFKTTGNGRNGLMPSVHIEGNHFHVDTANGGSIAGPIHWILDVLLGTYFPDFHDNGIPR